jgi:hypothetical protein
MATHLSCVLSNPQNSSNLVFHHFNYRLKKDQSPAIRIDLLSLDSEKRGVWSLNDLILISQETHQIS